MVISLMWINFVQAVQVHIGEGCQNRGISWKIPNSFCQLLFRLAGAQYGMRNGMTLINHPTGGFLEGELWVHSHIPYPDPPLDTPRSVGVPKPGGSRAQNESGASGYSSQQGETWAVSPLRRMPWQSLWRCRPDRRCSESNQPGWVWREWVRLGNPWRSVLTHTEFWTCFFLEGPLKWQAILFVTGYCLGGQSTEVMETKVKATSFKRQAPTANFSFTNVGVESQQQPHLQLQPPGNHSLYRTEASGRI